MSEISARGKGGGGGDFIFFLGWRKGNTLKWICMDNRKLGKFLGKMQMNRNKNLSWSFPKYRKKDVQDKKKRAAT